MLYTVIAVVIAVIAAAVALAGLRLLLGRHWLLGWLRGSAGLLLVAVAATAAFAAWDLRGYRQILAEKPVATLAFTRAGDQHYKVVLVDEEGNEQRHELYGDMWQLDVRLLKWSDGLARLGLRPGYRLDRLSGRYLSLEAEQRRPRSVVALGEGEPALDAWLWLQQLQAYIPLIDAQYGSATYLPMADGALYSVGMGPSGLVARPLNDRARLSIERWQ